MLKTASIYIFFILFNTNAQTVTPPTVKVLNTVNSPGNADDPHSFGYQGGPVITNPSVYYLFYGSWTSDQIALVEDFTKSLSGTPFYSIMRSYRTNTSPVISDNLNFKKSILDNYSKGSALVGQDISNLISGAINSRQFPADPQALYFVLTAPDVTFPGLCSSFCGWHSYLNWNQPNSNISDVLKYAFVGNAGTQCPGSCIRETNRPFAAKTPNGDAGLDGMISVIAHEIFESVSDPEINAWKTPSSAEAGDLCAWNFGPTFEAKNGADANQKLGDREYLIQMMWLNAQGGKCAQTVSGAQGSKSPGHMPPALPLSIVLLGILTL